MYDAVFVGETFPTRTSIDASVLTEYVIGGGNVYVFGGVGTSPAVEAAFFNPFLESGLERVVDSMDRSLQEHPRQMLVLYHNPLLENVIAASKLLKQSGATHQYSVYRSIG